MNNENFDDTEEKFMNYILFQDVIYRCYLTGKICFSFHPKDICLVFIDRT